MQKDAVTGQHKLLNHLNQFRFDRKGHNLMRWKTSFTKMFKISPKTGFRKEYTLLFLLAGNKDFEFEFF